MKKFVLAATCAVTTLFGTTLLAAPAAQASGTPGCVTRAEYRHVHKGMTKVKVHQKFGTAGKRMSRAASGGYVSEVRTYRVCHQRFSSIAISFSKNPGGVLRLDYKSAVWVS